MYNIYWFRNDLRLNDNTAFKKAAESSLPLACVYVLPEDFNNFGSQRKAFLVQSLTALEKNLKLINLKLYIQQEGIGDPLSKLDIAPQKIYATKSFNCLGIKEELQLAEKYDLELFSQGLLYDYSFLKDLPPVFTNFKNKAEKEFNRSPQVIEEAVSLSAASNYQLPIAEASSWVCGLGELRSNKDFYGGEDAAIERLNYYLWDSNHVETYKETRNGLLNFNDSSKLSPYLALGCISPRQIDSGLQNYEKDVCKNDSTYWLYYELLWRDYFKLLSLKFGEKLSKRSGIYDSDKKFEDDENAKEVFKKWRQGKTESHFVNANMLELLNTGWMSNRGRQNVASYLAKTLKIDWTWGASWFEKMLIDFDFESNWSNWAYVSGVGVDPRDRKFNVDLQAKRYDPDGKYQDKFLKK